jgi:hypothetical protein
LLAIYQMTTAALLLYITGTCMGCLLEVDQY